MNIVRIGGIGRQDRQHRPPAAGHRRGQVQHKSAAQREVQAIAQRGLARRRAGNGRAHQPLIGGVLGLGLGQVIGQLGRVVIARLGQAIGPQAAKIGSVLALGQGVALLAGAVFLAQHQVGLGGGLGQGGAGGDAGGMVEHGPRAGGVAERQNRRDARGSQVGVGPRSVRRRRPGGQQAAGQGLAGWAQRPLRNRRNDAASDAGGGPAPQGVGQAGIGGGRREQVRRLQVGGFHRRGRRELHGRRRRGVRRLGQGGACVGQDQGGEEERLHGQGPAV